MNGLPFTVTVPVGVPVTGGAAPPPDGVVVVVGGGAPPPPAAESGYEAMKRASRSPPPFEKLPPA